MELQGARNLKSKYDEEKMYKVHCHAALGQDFAQFQVNL